MATLLLNADAQPTSLLPLSTVEWQEAIRYLVLDKVRVLEWYENWIVRSPNWSTRVPAVIMLKEYQKPKNHARLSKKNVFLRDLYTCQYCGVDCQGTDATLDHVVPISLGGKGNWTNLVTACKPCNYKKGNQMKMKPKISPHKPDFWELVEKRRRLGFNYNHPSWKNYLG